MHLSCPVPTLLGQASCLTLDRPPSLLLVGPHAHVCTASCPVPTLLGKASCLMLGLFPYFSLLLAGHAHVPSVFTASCPVLTFVGPGLMPYARPLLPGLMLSSAHSYQALCPVLTTISIILKRDSLIVKRDLNHGDILLQISETL